MAHTYNATILWRRGEQPFTDRKYSRAHEWQLDGLTIPGSSAPGVVKVPMSREDAIDPEEALVAALSSCHMLFFLEFAARDGFVIDEYRDEAAGEMGKTATGKVMMSKITIRPRITFSGAKRPTTADLERLHHLAHENCYIANSFKGEVVISDL